LIFSRSGFDYAIARSDDLSFSLSPATDSVWDWGWIFAALRPSIITIVRHELWPGFIWSAKNYGNLVLIDASRSIGETNSKPKKLVRAALLAMFDKIYAVSKSDHDFFMTQYGLSKQQIVVSGDTKFDRVLERSKTTTKSSSRLSSLLSKINRRLVLGSAHPADLDCFIDAVKAEPNIIRDWHIVVAPHHIDKANIKLVQDKLHAAGLTGHAYTALSDDKTLDQDQILVLDTMGMLAETYSFGTAAFVGGACHYQVHNVLEPAVHGLNLAWGPKYENSQEAVQLVADKIATVIHTPVEFSTWLKNISAIKSGNDNETANAVGSLKGASDLIFRDWKTILNG
jgi:3-deoxy-D-manno-octulosonic-acid transferase